MGLEDRGLLTVGTFQPKTAVGEFRLGLKIVILQPAGLTDLGVGEFPFAKRTSENPTGHT
jgi:hypothetical protein